MPLMYRPDEEAEEEEAERKFWLHINFGMNAL